MLVTLIAPSCLRLGCLSYKSSIPIPMIIDCESQRVCVKYAYQRSSASTLHHMNFHYWGTYTLCASPVSYMHCSCLVSMSTMHGMLVRSTLRDCLGVQIALTNMRKYTSSHVLLLSFLFYLVPTTTTSSATRSTYKKSNSPELSSKYSHLESIKRNYRI